MQETHNNIFFNLFSAVSFVIRTTVLSGCCSQSFFCVIIAFFSFAKASGMENRKAGSEITHSEIHSSLQVSHLKVPSQNFS